MKQITLRFLVFLPILLFIDWLIMVVLGCTSNYCNASTTFFNTFYSYFGIILVIITFLLLLVLMFKHGIHHALTGK